MATARPKRGQMIDLTPDALFLAQPLQTRDGEDMGHVGDIAETVAAGKRLKHCVVVVRLEADEQPEGFTEPLLAGTNLVCDGFHTVRAVRKANTETGKQRKVPCTVYPGTYRDAVLAAAGGNEHPWAPLKRTIAARRRAVEMYFDQNPRSSLADAEAHCHVSRPLVVDVRRKLRGEGGSSTPPVEEEPAAEGGSSTPTPNGTAKSHAKPERKLVDWVEGEALYGKVRRFFAHVAEVHGDLIDKADLAGVAEVMNEVFDVVFKFGADPKSWKDRILKQRVK